MFLSNVESEYSSLKSRQSVLAALMTALLGNQLWDWQPCTPVMVIMVYAISVKVIKAVWHVLTSTLFNNTSRRAIKSRCPSAYPLLNFQARISLNW